MLDTNTKVKFKFLAIVGLVILIIGTGLYLFITKDTVKSIDNNVSDAKSQFIKELSERDLPEIGELDSCGLQQFVQLNELFTEKLGKRLFTFRQIGYQIVDAYYQQIANGIAPEIEKGRIGKRIYLATIEKNNVCSGLGMYSNSLQECSASEDIGNGEIDQPKKVRIDQIVFDIFKSLNLKNSFPTIVYNKDCSDKFFKLIALFHSFLNQLDEYVHYEIEHYGYDEANYISEKFVAKELSLEETVDSLHQIDTVNAKVLAYNLSLSLRIRAENKINESLFPNSKSIHESSYGNLEAKKLGYSDFIQHVDKEFENQPETKAYLNLMHAIVKQQPLHILQEILETDPPIYFNHLRVAITTNNLIALEALNINNILQQSPNTKYESVFTIAVTHNSYASFNHLIARGYDIEQPSQGGQDALDIALAQSIRSSEYYKYVDALLRNGKQIDFSHQQYFEILAIQNPQLAQRIERDHNIKIKRYGINGVPVE